MGKIEGYKPDRLDLTKTIDSIRYRSLNLVTTYDFPDTDPWFSLLAECNEKRPERFAGKKYLEFGIGGGLQAIAALKGFEERPDLSPIKNITGVDIDSWRLDIAAQNLNKFTIPYLLYQKDAIQWIRDQKEIITDTAITMCLPQAPYPKLQPDKIGLFNSNADVYHEDKLPEFAKKYNRYGLGLNAAVLGTLISHVGSNVNLSIVISGRVPEDIIRNMILDLGWKVVDIYETPEPIQQDPDTDVSYVSDYANESQEVLFWEKLSDGIFSPISAVEAQNRLVSANRDREKLNAYHYVGVLHLKSATTN